MISAQAPQPSTEPIVVQGYSPRFAAAVKHLLGIEGGHVNDPADRGGETNFGISLRFLAAEGAFDEDGDGKADFDLDMDGDIDGEDIRKLTKAEAVFLYHRCFWARAQAEIFPEPLGEMLFDQAVNGGLVAARKLLQRAINTCLFNIGLGGPRSAMPALRIDGVAGPATQQALVRVLVHPGCGVAELVAAYRDAVRERYRQIVARFPSQKRFLRGWLARADKLGRA